MPKIYIWDFIGGSRDIYGDWHNRPNSAGGYSVKLNFKNNTDKTIKYAIFFITPYNSVNDPVQCSISFESTDGLKYTGPLAPSGIATYRLWENVWYNNSISRVQLEHIMVIYMDDTVDIIPRSEVSFSKPEGVDGGGCYVATCVYGSYDCPQVWTLRRFRDNTLAETWYGRTFIRAYYAVSPTLVKWFGHTAWFKKMWRDKLDRLVARLNIEGVEATPYKDKDW